MHDRGRGARRRGNAHLDLRPDHADAVVPRIVGIRFQQSGREILAILRRGPEPVAHDAVPRVVQFMSRVVHADFSDLGQHQLRVDAAEQREVLIWPDARLEAELGSRALMPLIAREVIDAVFPGALRGQAVGARPVELHGAKQVHMRGPGWPRRDHAHRARTISGRSTACTSFTSS